MFYMIYVVLVYYFSMKEFIHISLINVGVWTSFLSELKFRYLSYLRLGLDIYLSDYYISIIEFGYSIYLLSKMMLDISFILDNGLQLFDLRSKQHMRSKTSIYSSKIIVSLFQ